MPCVFPVYASLALLLSSIIVRLETRRCSYSSHLVLKRLVETFDHCHLKSSVMKRAVDPRCAAEGPCPDLGLDLAC